jgi:hypothetical protein
VKKKKKKKKKKRGRSSEFYDPSDRRVFYMFEALT